MIQKNKLTLSSVDIEQTVVFYEKKKTFCEKSDIGDVLVHIRLVKTPT